MGFYLEHLGDFAKPVEELMGFLCQAELLDITIPDYYKLSPVSIPKYVNLPLYMEKGKVKLGLIDLEEFNLYSNLKGKEMEILHACKQAIRFFPYHFEVILNTAKKFWPEIEKHQQTLEEERGLVVDFFNKIYNSHLDFVNEKNININTPHKFEKISEIRKQKIREVIEEWIQQENKDDHFKNCLGNNPDETLKLFSEIAFPEILNMIEEFIVLKLNKSIEYYGGKEKISSYSNLLAARTLKFKVSDLEGKIASKLDMLKIENGLFKETFAYQIIIAFFKELENGKEIAYYNPSFSVQQGVQCIFC